MQSVGVDIIEIERIARAVARWGDSFLNRIFTPAELERYRDRLPELAARFAGKEAISKALGTGIKGIRWRDMEILADGRGKPEVRLYARAKRRAEELGLKEFSISLSHCREYAVAFVVATDK